MDLKIHTAFKPTPFPIPQGKSIICQIQRITSGALYPVPHELFTCEEAPDAVRGILRHGNELQLSYTIALIFLGYKLTDKGWAFTWHLATSPAFRDLAVALDMPNRFGNDLGDAIKRIAYDLSFHVPLIMGSCVYARICHCGHTPPVITLHYDFLHGVERIRRNALRHVWFPNLHTWFKVGFMAPVPDLWNDGSLYAGNMNEALFKLSEVASRLVPRVELMPEINQLMIRNKVPFTPRSSSPTVVFVPASAKKRMRMRDLGHGGMTTYRGPDDKQAPPKRTRNLRDPIR